MKNLLKAYLVALTLAMASQLPAAAQKPELRAGVSVEMPVTTSAVPLPDADSRDALIVAVTRDGKVYFGIDPVSPAGLAEKMKGAMSGGAVRKLYLKADARARFSGVISALAASREAGVAALNFLTAQRDTSEATYPVPPTGLEVLIGPQRPPTAQTIVVQAVDSSGSPVLTVDGKRIPSDSFQGTIAALVKGARRRTVLLTADERLTFRDVIGVIDRCHSAGANVFLTLAGQ